MEEKDKKFSFVRLMRALHRDIGYLMIGLMVMYSLSGLQLIHRGTNFLKYKKTTEMELSPNLSLDEVAAELRMFDTSGATNEGGIITFSNGTTYNTTTGETLSISMQVIWPFDELSWLHKTGGSSIGKIFTTTGAIMLFFLAISSFWMYKVKTKKFRRGIILAILGFAVALFVFLTV